MSALPAVALAQTRAALAAGATPGAALLAGFSGDARLDPVLAGLRLGMPLAALVPDADTGDASTDLLVRALAVAEQTGAGGGAGVDQAIGAAQEEAVVIRLLRSRTAQARGTAALLAALPLVGWLGVAVLGGSATGFLATPLGLVTTTAAIVLAGGGWLASRRIIATAAAAGAGADPLRPRSTRDRRRTVVVAAPAMVVAGALAGPVAALVVTAVAVALTGPRRCVRPAAGGSTEAIELVSVALTAGLSPSAALAAVAPLAPGPAREVLAMAARRVRAGWTPGEAFAGSGLQPLGEVLDATQRWGAPAEQALRSLAADLRAQRRAAAEEAAERAQLLLVFPTTLLTLPAFVLAVVPALLWGAFSGG